MLELVKSVFKKNLQIISIFNKSLYDEYPNSRYFSDLILDINVK